MKQYFKGASVLIDRMLTKEEANKINVIVDFILKERTDQFKKWLMEDGYMEKEVVPKRKPTHGNCCTCQDCGYYHDECVCESNEWHKRFKSLEEV